MANKSIDYGRDDEFEDPYASVETETPLVAAVLSGDANAVRNLIDRGVDVNTFDVWIEGWAIGVAIEQNRCDLVEVLLDAGASPDAGDICNTSLELAARQNNLDIFQLLLAAGAEVNQEIGEAGIREAS
jgi:ankyrin repeat protein